MWHVTLYSPDKLTSHTWHLTTDTCSVTTGGLAVAVTSSLSCQRLLYCIVQSDWLLEKCPTVSWLAVGALLVTYPPLGNSRLTQIYLFAKLRTKENGIKNRGLTEEKNSIGKNFPNWVFQIHNWWYFIQLGICDLFSDSVIPDSYISNPQLV